MSCAAVDPRLTALAAGSYIHHGFDEYSDLDFVIVCDERDYGKVMTSRLEFAQRIGELLQVDFKFVTLGDLDRLVERPAVLFARDAQAVEARLDAAAIAWPEATPDWFERRAWIWLHYGASKLARGELYEAIGILGFFREQVLGPMLHRRAGRPQRGVRRIETLAEEAGAQLAATAPGPDKASVRAALLAAIALYVELRADEPPSEAVAQMPGGLLDYVARHAGVQ
ncbi:nucleotidyltransferase domain-containing protein [Bordetella bronchiseptica]